MNKQFTFADYKKKTTTKTTRFKMFMFFTVIQNYDTLQSFIYLSVNLRDINKLFDIGISFELHFDTCHKRRMSMFVV